MDATTINTKSIVTIIIIIATWDRYNDMSLKYIDIILQHEKRWNISIQLLEIMRTYCLHNRRTKVIIMH